MRGHFSEDSLLAGRILHSLRHPPLRIKNIQDLGRLYETKVWIPLNDLDAVLDEIHHVIHLLSTLETYTDAVIAVKFYIIAWRTLSDVFAKLVNAVFDLGIDEQDIDLMTIFRNEHVKQSGLPEILEKYRAKIRHGDFSRLRNDIVHRGILRDPGLEAINSRLVRLKLLRLFDEAQAAEESKAIESDLHDYLLSKQSEFTGHSRDTIAMLEEMIGHLDTIVKTKLDSIRSN
jgi:hypothetical protein